MEHRRASIVRRIFLELALALVVFVFPSSRGIPISGGIASARQQSRTLLCYCIASGQSPIAFDQVALWLGGKIDGNLLGSSWFYGTESVEGYLDRQIEVLQATQYWSCPAEFHWSGPTDFAEPGFTIPGRYPDALTNDQNQETFTYWQPGSYLRTRVYQTTDNYGWPYEFVEDVNEEYEVFETQNGCNLTIVTASTQTNTVGRFIDRYGDLDGQGGALGIPACAIPQYQSCQSTMNQHLTVAGVPFSHEVIWRCSDVQIAR